MGMLLVAVGLAALSMVSAATSYLPYGVALVIVAVGAGLCVPTFSTGIVTALPPAKAGMDSGLNSAVREIGAALGVAVVGSVLASQFRRDLPDALRDHAHSTFQALHAARALGPDVHAAAVAALTDAMATGLRAVAAIVLLALVVISARDRSGGSVPTATHGSQGVQR